jgi:ATPase subunit of ABC transporter with duplicated ATPase domains
MQTITHDGATYVLQSDMEAAFKDRIQKLSARAIQAEEQVKAIQDQMDNQTGELAKIQKLSARVQELEQELDGANSRYERHTAMADLGFQDPDIRDLVEWQYEKAMKGQKEKVTLAEWLQDIKADPTKAPVTLRPHLKAPVQEAQAPVDQAVNADPQVSPEPPAQDSPVMLPPKTNTGTVQAPVQSSDLLKRAESDFEFYRENRDAIRKAYRGY